MKTTDFKIDQEIKFNLVMSNGNHYGEGIVMFNPSVGMNRYLAVKLTTKCNNFEAGCEIYVSPSEVFFDPQTEVS